MPGGDAVPARLRGAGSRRARRSWSSRWRTTARCPSRWRSRCGRPDPDGQGAVEEVSAEGTEVRVDGRLVLLAARAPGRRVARAQVDGDVAEVVLGGGAQPEAAVGARCRDGRAQAAVVFPLAHTATLRIVLPFDGGTLDVDALPTAAQVASGWRVHTRRGTRLELPDRSPAGRHRRQRVPPAPAARRVAGGGCARPLRLRRGGRPDAARRPRDAPRPRGARRAPAGAHRPLDPHPRRGLRGCRGAPGGQPGGGARRVRERRPSCASVSIAAGGAAGMLAAAGQARGAEDVRRAGVAMATASADAPPPPPAPPGVGPLLEMLRTASPTWTWAGPDDGHELDVGAALLVGARGLLVNETEGDEPELVLSQHIPPDWFGQGWEVHDLPTAHGRLSYAVRWHGDRPALLWELVGWPGAAPGAHHDAPAWTRAGRRRRPAATRSWPRCRCRRRARGRDHHAGGPRAKPRPGWGGGRGERGRPPVGQPDRGGPRRDHPGPRAPARRSSAGPRPTATSCSWPSTAWRWARSSGTTSTRSVAARGSPRRSCATSGARSGSPIRRPATRCSPTSTWRTWPRWPSCSHGGVVAPEVAYGMTRVVGSSMARIASALIDAVSARAEAVARAGGDGDDAVAVEPMADEGSTFLSDLPRCARAGVAAPPPGRRPAAAAALRERGQPRHGRRLRRPGGLHGAGPAGDRRGAGRGGGPVRAAGLRRRRGRRRAGAQDDRRRGDVPRRGPGGGRRDRARAGRRVA